jgi:hypothetical protein
MTDGQQRIGALVEVPQILREMGEDPTTVIAGAGIESDLLRNPENSVSFAELGRLLQACVAAIWIDRWATVGDRESWAGGATHAHRADAQRCDPRSMH